MTDRAGKFVGKCNQFFLTKLSTCSLYVAAMEELFRSGAMSSRISQLNMIDILYTAFINRNYHQNIRSLEHNQIEKKVID